MDERYSDVRVKVVKAVIPKRCVCPSCGLEQVFVKDHEHWKKVKDLSIDKPTLLSVQVLSAKCVNTNCQRRSFIVTTAGVEKYQRATTRVKDEALNKNILDNIAYQRTAASLNRLNASGSKSSIDRWKRSEGELYSFKDIISRLGFSGVLSIDEYKPKRAKHYDLIAGDALRWRILYLESVPLSPKRAGTVGRGSIERFCMSLKELGITPWVVIVDLMAAYPKQVRKIWPGVLIQYDYFHVMQLIHKYLKNGLLQFRRQLQIKATESIYREVWEHKWRILKNMDHWSAKDHRIIPELLVSYRGSPVEAILLFKEQLHQIFNASTSKKEAYAKRDSLYKEQWWAGYWHLRKVMEFLMSPKFEYMINYIDDQRIPRSGNIENLIAIWRQMEKVRRGFKSQTGRQNHLKLYQMKHYLTTPPAENSGKSTSIAS
jgi:transposase